MDLWNEFPPDFAADSRSADDDTNADDKDADDVDNDDKVLDIELTPMYKVDDRCGDGGMGGVGGSRRSTTTAKPLPASQINSTDKFGMPINYELGAMYVCPQCGTEYRTQDLWRSHINAKHQYNTRTGLNFVRVDKLYQRCRECHRNIAMHSMENLLKHKFTHLPYPCTKCFFCRRDFKYRQDLMAHLRVEHHEQAAELTRKCANKTSDMASVTNYRRSAAIVQPPQPPPVDIRSRLSIACVEGAPESDDEVVVKQEILVPEIEIREDTPEQDQQADDEEAVEQQSASTAIKNIEFPKSVINYDCPACNATFDSCSKWMKHIDFVHDFASTKGLNFKLHGSRQQARCLECELLLPSNDIKAMQLHKFSHSKVKNWLRCIMCRISFRDQDLVRQHLLKKHKLRRADLDSRDAAATSNDDSSSQQESTTRHSNGRSEYGGRYNFINDEYEKFIEYLCPHCGKEFKEKRAWRQHTQKEHEMSDFSKMNFKFIGDKNLECLECHKIITCAYGLQNAQQHRTTHLPYKAFSRCSFCQKCYTDRKGLVKHLRQCHNIIDKNDEPNSPVKVMTSRMPTTTPTPAPAPEPTPPPLTAPVRRKIPRREIVTVEGQTFEITYLDESDDDGGNGNDDNRLSLGNAAGGGSRQLRLGTTNTGLYLQYSCVDCASTFKTSTALQAHIKEEHEFEDPIRPPSSALGFRKRRYSLTEGTQAPAKASRLPLTIDEVDSYFVYLCPECGLKHKTQAQWRLHINSVHHFDKRERLNFRQIDKFRFECRKCKDVLTNLKLKGLQDHHFRHLQHRLYLQCVVCQTRYNHKPNMLGHLRTRHKIYEGSTDADLTDMQPVASNSQDIGAPKAKQIRHSLPLSANNKATTSSAATYNAAQAKTPTSKLRMSDSQLMIKPPELTTIEDGISFHNAIDLDFITYFCPACNENFDTHAVWRKHIVDAHNLNTIEGLNFQRLNQCHFLCLECCKQVTVKHAKGAIGQLQSHKFRHLKYRSFKCLTCSNLFVRKQMFFKHLDRRTNRCHKKPVAHKTIQSQLLSGLDESRVLGQRNGQPILKISLLNASHQKCTFRLVCPVCGQRFYSQVMWRNHIDEQHSLCTLAALRMEQRSDHKYRCRYCNRIVKSGRLRDLQLHAFRHYKHPKHIVCNICPTETLFAEIEEMSKHLRQVHPHLSNESARMQEFQEYEKITLSGKIAGLEEAPSLKKVETESNESKATLNGGDGDSPLPSSSKAAAIVRKNGVASKQLQDLLLQGDLGQSEAEAVDEEEEGEDEDDDDEDDAGVGADDDEEDAEEDADNDVTFNEASNGPNITEDDVGNDEDDDDDVDDNDNGNDGDGDEDDEEEVENVDVECDIQMIDYDDDNAIDESVDNNVNMMEPYDGDRDEDDDGNSFDKDFELDDSNAQHSPTDKPPYDGGEDEDISQDIDDNYDDEISKDKTIIEVDDDDEDNDNDDGEEERIGVEVEVEVLEGEEVVALQRKEQQEEKQITPNKTPTISHDEDNDVEMISDDDDDIGIRDNGGGDDASADEGNEQIDNDQCEADLKRNDDANAVTAANNTTNGIDDNLDKSSLFKE